LAKKSAIKNRVISSAAKLQNKIFSQKLKTLNKMRQKHPQQEILIIPCFLYSSISG